MNFEILNGTLCIVDHGELIVSDITGYLKHSGNHYNVLTVPAEGSWMIKENIASCDNLTIESSPLDDGILIRSTFRNMGEAITVPCNFTAFSGILQRTPDRMIVNRPYSANGLRVCEMQSPVDTIHTVYNSVYESAENTVFDTEEGDAFVFGAATYQKYFSCVTVSREGCLTAYCNTELHTLKTGDTVTSDWFLLAPCDDCVSGLDKFARTVATLASVKPTNKENPFGYCSWYYYGRNISADTMRQNMKSLCEKKDLLPVQYIQIDEGWNDGWGTWQANEKFGDMKALADEIKENGFIPGIWIAPFGCHPDKQLAKDHPDWFVKNAKGEPWCTNALCLDFTNPEVRDYIGGIFRRLSYDWGFRYIKLDIITPNLAAGVHFDPNATALENYRLGLQTFRENITDDTFLLGCTAPFGGAVGYVDGMRVSGDIFERWESLRCVFNAVLKRYYYHRNYYLIDADCLIVRKKENEDEECFRLCTRTDDEIRTYVTAMAASGGILMLSDKLPLLSDEQFKLISKLYPLNQNSALPLDLMDSYIPGILDFGKKGSTRTVALINWSNAPRTMRVENQEAFVWEFWGQTFDLHHGGSYSIQVPPHSARVLYFTDLDDVAVVGSDASVVMQTPWAKDGKRIIGKMIKADETIFVASRTPIQAIDCEASASFEANEYTVYQVTSKHGSYTLK